MDTETSDKSINGGALTDRVDEFVTKRVSVNKVTLSKMMGIKSLFNDELPDDAKDTEIVSYFLEKSFACLLQSGEIARRLQKLIE